MRASREDEALDDVGDDEERDESEDGEYDPLSRAKRVSERQAAVRKARKTHHRSLCPLPVLTLTSLHPSSISRATSSYNLRLHGRRVSEAYAAGEARIARFQFGMGRVREEVPAGVGLLGKGEGRNARAGEGFARCEDEETGYIGGGVWEAAKVEGDSPAESYGTRSVLWREAQ